MLRSRSRSRTLLVLVLVAAMGLTLSLTPIASAAEEEPPKGPPLPLHTIEGVGGLVLTPTAYLVNPGPPGTVVGKPSFSLQYARIGHKDFQAAAATVTLWERLELGYAANRLGLDDFDKDVRTMTGIDIGPNDIYMHNFNARLNLIQEGAWDRPWMPAVTVGAHYKYNDDINDIDRDLGGTLTGLGYNDNDGVDYTLTATKAIYCLPRPVLLSAGARASRGSQLGLVGFTDDYMVTFEGSALMLVTDRLAVGAEYRQKRNDLNDIPGLIGDEDSWWDVHAAYIINNHAELYATVGSAGTVLNHDDELLWGAVFKYEF
ncbi:MAG: DUF3034 family protein [Candidatus Brocadiia bacterium]